MKNGMQKKKSFFSFIKENKTILPLYLIIIILGIIVILIGVIIPEYWFQEIDLNGIKEKRISISTTVISTSLIFIGQSLTIGGIFSLVFEFSVMREHFRSAIIDIVGSKSYLKKLNIEQLKKLREKTVERISKNEGTTDKGLLALDKQLFENISNPNIKNLRKLREKTVERIFKYGGTKDIELLALDKQFSDNILQPYFDNYKLDVTYILEGDILKKNNN